MIQKYLKEQFNFNYPYSGLFYCFETGLRFEISDSVLWKKNIELCYKTANNLASDIICNTFSEDDNDFHIIIRHYRYKRSRISKNSKVMKSLKHENNGELNISYFKSYEANFDFDTKQIFATLQSKFSKTLIEKIIPLITANEMCHRKPKTRYKIFFISKTTNTIVHYYDDRGLDVISKDKDILIKLYNLFNSNICPYDRTEIDAKYKSMLD